MEYFKREDEEEFECVNKQDYYLAQIAAMIVAVNSKNPKRIRIDDFIIKLKLGREQKKKLTKEERTRIAKAFWLPMLANAPKKKNKKPKK